jgi:hypothetical protein
MSVATELLCPFVPEFWNGINFLMPDFSVCFVVYNPDQEVVSSALSLLSELSMQYPELRNLFIESPVGECYIRWI